MIIPSVDIIRGQAVQLIGGKGEPVVQCDPYEAVERFAILPEIALVDLDAARGVGENTDLIRDIIDCYPNTRFRVGGGLRTHAKVNAMLSAGADRVVIGTQANPEFLAHFPRNRVIAALDILYGHVQINGWETPAPFSFRDSVKQLRDLVSGFLVTFIEYEGRSQGTHPDARTLIKDIPNVTVAGGVATVEEVEKLSKVGASVQLGMALYTGKLSLGQAFASSLHWRSTILPTVIQDTMGTVLGLVYSSPESLAQLIDTRKGVYQSRVRGLWEKGVTSGNTHEVIRIEPDCDGDSILVTVKPAGPNCHTDTYSCFGPAQGVSRLVRTISNRVGKAPERSYTARLLAQPHFLALKLEEEARELGEHGDVVHEAADLLYHMLVRLRAAHVDWADVMEELNRRSK